MRTVSLFGYGKTTKALTRLYPNAIFYDDKCLKPFTDENGSRVRPSSEFDPKYSHIEITSPGIPPSNPMIKKAKNLISEYDVFKDTAPLKIWISGTNGKTTTTQMMYHLLKDRGAQTGGNIGTPLAQLNENASMWILETSSFTIHYTQKALPNIYVLLPIKPDHLSWHKNMNEYINAKLKPIKNMKEGEIALIPQEYKDIETSAHVITYKSHSDIAAYFGIDTKKIDFKGAFLMDALLAMAVEKILLGKIDYKKINSFVIEPHRQEELRDAKDRLWVNDTKATNIDASIAALERYKETPVHLILGGDDKGVDLNELFVYLKDIDVKIYNIGSNKDKLSSLAKEYDISYERCNDLTDAVKRIDKNLKRGETALLSPAAASLDEFDSYAHRGDIFKKAVKDIS